MPLITMVMTARKPRLAAIGVPISSSKTKEPNNQPTIYSTSSAICSAVLGAAD